MSVPTLRPAAAVSVGLVLGSFGAAAWPGGSGISCSGGIHLQGVGFVFPISGGAAGGCRILYIYIYIF